MQWSASDIGRTTDAAFVVITGICIAIFLLIVITAAWLTLRYSRKRNPVPVDIEGHVMLEAAWTAGPVALVMFMFWYGWIGYDRRRAPLEGALEVRSNPQMWQWSFEYPGGKTGGELWIPVGRPVKIILKSRDVIHSLYIPAFRVKQDALPGVERTLWFTPEKKGDYDIFCTEYCGTGHSQMLSKVVVMDETEFKEWEKRPAEALSTPAPPGVPAAPAAPAPGAAERGAELLKSKGCRVCHTVDGSPLIGPSLKGVYGKKERVVTGGKEREVTVDDEYIRRSLYEPASDVVKGFQPIMPPQKGLVSEEELKATIEYIRTLK